MPLRTATPNKAMNPTPAEMLKGIPRTNRASRPPVAARGMFKKDQQCRTADPKLK